MERPFSGCIALLCSDLPSLPSLGQALGPLARPFRGSAPGSAWALGYPGFFLPCPLGGHALVDLVPERWPDSLGLSGDPPLLTAWSAGALGPTTAPGALARAVQHAPELPEGAKISDHRGFIRLRWTGALAAAGRPATRQLEPYLVELAASILAADLPEIFAYFHPSGEVVLNRSGFAAQLQYAKEGGHPPVALWSAIRLFRVGDPQGWALMDLVGLQAWDRSDVEVAFLPGMRTDLGKATREPATPTSIARFLRNLSIYLLGRGDIMLDGHFTEGPGSRFRVTRVARSLVDPPREVIRLLPVDAGPLPELLDDGWRAPVHT
jgi:hypothetical protein